MKCATTSLDIELFYSVPVSFPPNQHGYWLFSLVKLYLLDSKANSSYYNNPKTSSNTFNFLKRKKIYLCILIIVISFIFVKRKKIYLCILIIVISFIFVWYSVDLCFFRYGCSWESERSNGEIRRSSVLHGMCFSS